MAPRALNKLNDKAIKAAIRLQSGQTSGVKMLSDGGGLYLRVDAGGGARWVYRYTPQHGRPRDMGLGGYPVTTLATARKLALAQREAKAVGSDPVELRRQQKVAESAARRLPTFGAVADEYIRERVPVRRGNRKAGGNAKHVYQWGITLGDRYCRDLRAKPVDQVTMEDIKNILLQEVTVRRRVHDEDGSGAVRTVSGPMWSVMHTTAKRLRERIKIVMDYARVKKHCSGENPAAWAGNLEHELTVPVVWQRRQPWMPYEEVPAFIASLRQREATTARALEFLILTAVRAGNVRLAEWKQFDLEARVWNIPGEQMKSGLPHRVPLTTRMLELIEEMSPDPAGRDGLVFPGGKPGAPLSDMSFNALMNRRMGLDNVTAHGFRSSFRQWAGARTSFPWDVAEAALAHKVGSKVERAYWDGDAFEKRRHMMEAWEAFCTDKQTAERNVVPLRA